jgi:hypothetical protein
MAILIGNLKEIRRKDDEFIIVNEDIEPDTSYMETDTFEEARKIAEKILNVSCYHKEEKTVKYPIIASYTYYLKSNHKYVGSCKIMYGPIK